MLKFRPDKTINPKILINIGALMDIPTGTIVTGRKGESVINGGLGLLTAVVGMGNRFKSTILHYMSLQAMNRVLSTNNTSLSTYDTEINMDEATLGRLTTNMEFIDDNQLFDADDPSWAITDKSLYLADEWAELLKSYIKDKIADKKNIVDYTPFTRKGVPYKNIAPTFVEIDSLSEFEAANTIEIQDDVELGNSSANMLFMKQGMAKTRFLMDLPRLANRSTTYFLMTAHVAKDISISTGPGNMPPPKKLQHLRMGDKIKGVSDKFFFLMSNSWYVLDAKPYTNQTTREAEYPLKDSGDSNMDLNIAKIVQLRGKSGPSGYILELLISQIDGVLPELTEFHHIKQNNRFGLEGTVRNYRLDLCPEISLSRTTIRGKINSSPELRRAINITSEMLQIFKYWPSMSKYKCTPKELYDSLKEQGYDWNVLLNTRGWWAINQYDHKIPFLSTPDLLKMRLKEYKPFWLNKKDK